MSGLFLIVCAWLATGTLAPYAATTETVRLSEPCHYLLNEDDGTYRATFYFMEGRDRSLWSESVVLRRVLYPLVSFPFMKVLGFQLGGFIANVALHLLAFIGFVFFIRRRYGESSAIWSAWLLTTYPGIYYWIGVPYCYAAIVPASLACFMLLSKMEDMPMDFLLPACLALGVLFLSYDLFTIFGPPAIVLVAVRTRRPAFVLAALALLALPSAAVTVFLKKVFHLSFHNANTANYSNLLGSYVHVPDLHRWLRWLKSAPYFFHENYFSSNFVVLPWFFLALLLLNSLSKPLSWTWTEKLVGLSVLALWAFINLAPANDAATGNMLRGEFAPRFYQPFFVVILSFAVRKWAQADKAKNVVKPWMAGLMALAVTGNVFICLGPLANSRFSSYVYARFYKHTPNGNMKMVENLDKYGRRPLGFCR